MTRITGTRNFKTIRNVIPPPGRSLSSQVAFMEGPVGSFSVSPGTHSAEAEPDSDRPTRLESQGDGPG